MKANTYQNEATRVKNVLLCAKLLIHFVSVCKTCWIEQFLLHWNWNLGEGTSDYPCSEIYRGEEEMSEPEVKGMANKILQLKDELHAYVSLHSFSELFLMPYGFESDAAAPEDFNEMVRLRY